MEIPENTHARVIQDIRYAGQSPYVQYDILDARTLLHLFTKEAPQFSLNSRRLGRILRDLGMRLVGLYHIDGRQCKVWTCLPYQPTEGIIRTFRHRVKSGMVELHTELTVSPEMASPPAPLPLLPSFERQVLSLFLLRSKKHRAKPREIAKEMDCAVFQVNRSFQVIRRKLRLSTLTDVERVKRAVRESGCLMDDPAFS